MEGNFVDVSVPRDDLYPDLEKERKRRENETQETEQEDRERCVLETAKEIVLELEYVNIHKFMFFFNFILANDTHAVILKPKSK